MIFCFILPSGALLVIISYILSVRSFVTRFPYVFHMSRNSTRKFKDYCKDCKCTVTRWSSSVIEQKKVTCCLLLHCLFILEEQESQKATILVKILGTSHKIALLQSLITCPPLPPFQCCLNQTPFDHLNIELGGKGDYKVLNIRLCVDILENIMKTPKFESVPAYFDQDCRFV